MELQYNDAPRSMRDYAESAHGIDADFKHRFSSWLSAQYELNTAALADLGLGEEAAIPAYEQVRDAVWPGSMLWLANRSETGHEDRLVVAPSVQNIGLMGSKYEPGIVPRFDEGQGFMRKTKISKPWQALGDKDPLHDNGNTALFSAAIVLDGRTTPPDPSTTKNGHETAEQTYAHNASLEQKRALLEEEKARETKSDRTIAAIAVSQLIVVAAQERQLDRSASHKIIGTTALIHYPTFKKDGRDKDSVESQPTFYLEKPRHLQIALGERWTEVADETVRRTLRLSL